MIRNPEHDWLYEGYPCAFGWACTYTTDTAGRPIMLKSRHKRWQLLAGGMIDADELPWEAAIRETMEETGRILTGDPKLLAAVFRLPTAEFPTRFGYIFDGGVMTDAEIEAIALDPREHTDYAVKSIAEWQRIVPTSQYDLVCSLEAARRTGVAAYITTAVD
ncbi:8-oxo-dGTP diphosphatase [Kitasatospora sp. MAP12-15]|uniref:NUDIX hydrolase n=1 Tax=unclassified Kitasatospora TaxID=2633591 RepID=UPI002476720C|nr:NUDIX hydrolase [Kitasatospora sp. MAP12-44]MDH6108135.1 8-oxo-dGTP diphosphatase [Kitasatospora sp. MAP12-44]